MLRIVSVFVVALIVLVLPGRAADIAVTGGIVRGEDLADGSIAFQGIPYAAPPVGALRWEPPQPVVPWSGIRDATKLSTPCIQPDQGWNTALVPVASEDCLYLSIRAPKHEASKKHPVFFWIHGGGNRAGNGYGRNTALYRRDIVLVSIEYRLGLFGFLSHPELTRASPQHVSGNYALMDMIAALQWVKTNIARFGGDPANVTIGGQSAGAADVGMLLVSPHARGLFHKAVIESGPANLSVPSRTLEQNEKIGLDLQRLTNATDLKALRGKSAAELLAAGEKLSPPDGVDTGMLWVQSIVDGYMLARPPAETLARNEQAQVPLIIGDVTQEFPLDGAPDTILKALKNFFGAKADQAAALYGIRENEIPAADPVLGSIGTQVMTDGYMRCPANAMARFQAGQSVWRYQFGVPRAGLPWPPAHNAELSYVFEAAPPDATFGTWPPVQQYWANFFRSGDPNGAGLPQWPQMGGDKIYMAFTPQGPVLGKDLRGSICRLMNGGP